MANNQTKVGLTAERRGKNTRNVDRFLIDDMVTSAASVGFDCYDLNTRR